MLFPLTDNAPIHPRLQGRQGSCPTTNSITATAALHILKASSVLTSGEELAQWKEKSSNCCSVRPRPAELFLGRAPDLPQNDSSVNKLPRPQLTFFDLNSQIRETPSQSFETSAEKDNSHVQPPVRARPSDMDKSYVAPHPLLQE